MIIIWGSRGLTSTLDSGRFYCPTCDDDDCNYERKQVREWFTLYFIPIFPVGGQTYFVECRECRGTFKESVLDLEHPTPEERALRGLMETIEEELLEGVSLQGVEAWLVKKKGLSPDDARAMVDRVAGDDVWKCDGCKEHFIDEVKRCPECER